MSPINAPRHVPAVAKQVLHSPGQLEEAEYILTRAARDAALSFSAANSAKTLAFSYLIPQGRLDEAEEVLRRAIELDAGEASIN